MWTRLLSMLALAYVWTGLVPAVAQTNAIRNGSFEEMVKGDALPAQWAFAWENTHSNDSQRGYKKQKPDFGLDDTTAKAGRYSFRIGVRRPKDDGVLTQERVPATKGTKVYVVKAWLKTSDMKAASAHVALVSLDAKGKWLAANYSAISTRENHDWKQYAGYFMAHAQAAFFRVRLWLNFNYSGTGTVWYDDVRLMPTNLKGMPPIRYEDDNPMPRLDSHWQDAGLVLFRRTYLEMIFPNSVPRADEIGGVLHVAATKGEAEPISFCVRALRDVKNVGVSFTDFVGEGAGRIPASSIRIGLVRCIYKRGQARWGAFADGRMLMPAYVEPGRAFDLPANTTRQVWATLHVPANAKPGVYTAKALVKPDKGPERSLHVRLTVLPIKLEEPRGVAFGMYAKHHDHEDGRQDTLYADMRAHGMTTVGHCGNLGAAIKKAADRVEVEFNGQSSIERVMAAYVKAGFPEPFVWLMGRDIERWCLKQGTHDSREFADCYRQVILSIIEHGKASGWPEIIFQPIDEPFEHTKRMEVAKRCLQILKTIPGLRTEEDGPNGNPGRLEEVYALCDVIVQHDGPVMERRRYDAKAWQDFLARTKRDGKQVWFYNIDLTGCHPEVMRWGYGFGLWFSGATGMIEWAYQFPVRRGDPAGCYMDKAIVFAYPAWKDEPGGPAIGWEGIREGVDDYKYIYSLHQLMGKASGRAAARPVAAEAKRYIESLRAKTDFRAHEGSACQGDWTGPKRIAGTGEKTVSGSYKMANGWTFEDYDAARSKIADLIVRLERAL